MKMLPNNSVWHMLGLAILLVFTTLAGTAQKPGMNGWAVIGPGGGDTTIGPTISPHDSRLVVEHCDMTGGYVTSDNGLSWRMFNLRGGIAVLAFDPIQTVPPIRSRHEARILFKGNLLAEP